MAAIFPPSRSNDLIYNSFCKVLTKPAILVILSGDNVSIPGVILHGVILNDLLQRLAWLETVDNVVVTYQAAQE